MISNLTIAGALAWAADVVEGSGAGQAGAAGGSPYTMILMFGGLFFVMYFLMIRPQQKRQKEHQAMLNALQKGDRVMTNGGIMGTVTGLDEKELTIEIAPQVRIKVGRGYVVQVIRPGAPNQTAAAGK